MSDIKLLGFLPKNIPAVQISLSGGGRCQASRV